MDTWVKLRPPPKTLICTKEYDKICVKGVKVVQCEDISAIIDWWTKFTFAGKLRNPYFHHICQIGRIFFLQKDARIGLAEDLKLA